MTPGFTHGASMQLTHHVTIQQQTPPTPDEDSGGFGFESRCRLKDAGQGRAIGPRRQGAHTLPTLFVSDLFAPLRTQLKTPQPSSPPSQRELEALDGIMTT